VTFVVTLFDLLFNPLFEILGGHVQTVRGNMHTKVEVCNVNRFVGIGI